MIREPSHLPLGDMVAVRSGARPLVFGMSRQVPTVLPPLPPLSPPASPEAAPSPSFFSAPPPVDNVLGADDTADTNATHPLNPAGHAGLAQARARHRPEYDGPVCCPLF